MRVTISELLGHEDIEFSGWIIPPLIVFVEVVLAKPDERFVAIRVDDSGLLALTLECVHCSPERCCPVSRRGRSPAASGAIQSYPRARRRQPPPDGHRRWPFYEFPSVRGFSLEPFDAATAQRHFVVAAVRVLGPLHQYVIGVFPEATEDVLGR